MLVGLSAVNLKNSRYRLVIKERGDNGRQHGNFCQRVGRASQPNYFTNMSPVDLHSRHLSRERRIFLATRPCALTIPRSSISESVQKLQLQRAAPHPSLCLFPRSLVPLLLLFLCFFVLSSLILRFFYWMRNLSSAFSHHLSFSSPLFLQLLFFLIYPGAIIFFFSFPLISSFSP